MEQLRQSKSSNIKNLSRHSNSSNHELGKRDTLIVETHSISGPRAASTRDWKPLIVVGTPPAPYKVYLPASLSPL